MTTKNKYSISGIMKDISSPQPFKEQKNNNNDNINPYSNKFGQSKSPLKGINNYALDRNYNCENNIINKNNNSNNERGSKSYYKYSINNPNTNNNDQNDESFNKNNFINNNKTTVELNNNQQKDTNNSYYFQLLQEKYGGVTPSKNNNKKQQQNSSQNLSLSNNNNTNLEKTPTKINLNNNNNNNANMSSSQKLQQKINQYSIKGQGTPSTSKNKWQQNNQYSSPFTETTKNNINKNLNVQQNQNFQQFTQNQQRNIQLQQNLDNNNINNILKGNGNSNTSRHDQQNPPLSLKKITSLNNQDINQRYSPKPSNYNNQPLPSQYFNNKNSNNNIYENSNITDNNNNKCNTKRDISTDKGNATTASQSTNNNSSSNYNNNNNNFSNEKRKQIQNNTKKLLEDDKNELKEIQKKFENILKQKIQDVPHFAMENMNNNHLNLNMGNISTRNHYFQQNQNQQQPLLSQRQQITNNIQNTNFNKKQDDPISSQRNLSQNYQNNKINNLNIQDNALRTPKSKQPIIGCETTTHQKGGSYSPISQNKNITSQQIFNNIFQNTNNMNSANQKNNQNMGNQTQSDNKYQYQQLNFNQKYNLQMQNLNNFTNQQDNNVPNNINTTSKKLFQQQYNQQLDNNTISNKNTSNKKEENRERAISQVVDSSKPPQFQLQNDQINRKLNYFGAEDGMLSARNTQGEKQIHHLNPYTLNFKQGKKQESKTPNKVNDYSNVDQSNNKNSPQKYKHTNVTNINTTSKKEKHKSKSINPVMGNNSNSQVTNFNQKQNEKNDQQMQQKGESIDLKQEISNDNDIENYKMGKILGLGSYAIVKLAQHKSGAYVAIKSYEKIKLQDYQKRKNVQREIRILSKLRHKNIVKLYNVIEGKTQLHLIEQYSPCRPLNQLLKQSNDKRITEDLAKTIFRQLADSIQYIHRKGVVHRDIKLENILIENSSSNNIRLIDFGFAIAIAPTAKINIFCGTPSYMAPEIVNKKEYAFPVDIWSLGILLYKLLTGNFPFRGKDDKQLYARINSCHLEFPPYVSQKAQNLLYKIIKNNPESRITAAEILKDPWLQDENDNIQQNQLNSNQSNYHKQQQQQNQNLSSKNKNINNYNQNINDYKQQYISSADKQQKIQQQQKLFNL